MTNVETFKTATGTANEQQQAVEAYFEKNGANDTTVYANPANDPNMRIKTIKAFYNSAFVDVALLEHWCGSVDAPATIEMVGIFRLASGAYAIADKNDMQMLSSESNVVHFGQAYKRHFADLIQQTTIGKDAATEKENEFLSFGERQSRKVPTDVGSTSISENEWMQIHNEKVQFLRSLSKPQEVIEIDRQKQAARSASSIPAPANV